MSNLRPIETRFSEEILRWTIGAAVKLGKPFDRFGGIMARQHVIATRSAAVAGLLLMCGFVLSDNPVQAADECLAAPNAAAPAGSHWYYRLERPTQRKCWYIGEAGRAVHSASPNLRATAKPPAPASAQVAVDQSTQPEPNEPEMPRTQSAWAPSNPAPTVAFVAQAPDSPAAASEQAVAYRANVEAPPANAAPQAAEAGEAAAPAPQASAKEAAKSAASKSSRMLLLVPAALAFAGVLARVIFSSAFGRRPTEEVEQVADLGAGAAGLRHRLPPKLRLGTAEPDRSVPQIEMPEDLRQTLRQVLQSLEVRAA
jgi:hypothetical protein